MKKFRFPLARVEHYRNLQLELAEEKLQELLHQAAQTRGEIARVEAEAGQAQAELRERAAQTAVAGAELAALDSYLGYSQRRKERLELDLLQLGGKIQEQRLAVTAADRNVEILRRMRQRTLRRWTAEWDKEVETTAAENFLARWNRQAAGRALQEPPADGG